MKYTISGHKTGAFTVGTNLISPNIPVSSTFPPATDPLLDLLDWLLTLLLISS